MSMSKKVVLQVAHVLLRWIRVFEKKEKEKGRKKKKKKKKKKRGRNCKFPSTTTLTSARFCCQSCLMQPTVRPTHDPMA
jgi:hypothetical protein